MSHVIIGILFSALGVSLVIKTAWFIENFGTNAWAEDKFGTSGGTRLFYKLFGLAIIFIGFLLITNLFSSFASSLVTAIFVH